jgi:pimeloyl-ACP methyl ester carboxylesterase
VGDAGAGARRIEIAGLSAIELGPQDAPVDIVFLHANGFHGAVYTHVLAPLAVGRRILAPDLRGHGHTSLPADPAMLTSWAPFTGDLARLLAAIDRPILLAGHSLGGALSCFAAAENPDRVRGLMLIEPVIAPPPEQRGLRSPDDPEVKRSKPIADAARNRRRVFASRQVAFDSYKGRGPFKTWPDEALRAYIEDGFADTPEGAALRCDPAWEAAIYLAFGSDLWGAIERLTPPLVVRAGDQHSTFHPDSERRLRALRPDADISRIPGATHFLPLERPDVARDAIELALSKARQGG